MQFLKLAATLAAAASAVSAFDITKPNPDEWWVAKSTNVLEWQCKTETTNPQYTVLIGNPNVPAYERPIASIAIINDYDCSLSIANTQADFPPATGYYIQLADPFNNTHVFATSQPFEIKPLGSLYASQENAGKPSNASGSAGGANPTSGSSSAGDEGSALGLASSTMAVTAAVAGVFAALF